jgi:hypothetical protein
MPTIELNSQSSNNIVQYTCSICHQHHIFSDVRLHRLVSRDPNLDIYYNVELITLSELLIGLAISDSEVAYCVYL